MVVRWLGWNLPRKTNVSNCRFLFILSDHEASFLSMGMGSKRAKISKRYARGWDSRIAKIRLVQYKTLNWCKVKISSAAILSEMFLFQTSYHQSRHNSMKHLYGFSLVWVLMRLWFIIWMFSLQYGDSVWNVSFSDLLPNKGRKALMEYIRGQIVKLQNNLTNLSYPSLQLGGNQTDRLSWTMKPFSTKIWSRYVRMNVFYALSI